MSNGIDSGPDSLSQHSSGRAVTPSGALYAIAGAIVVFAIVGNALTWTEWTTVYRTRSTPTAWLVGQFFVGLAVPLGLAGLVIAVALALGQWSGKQRRG